MNSKSPAFAKHPSPNPLSCMFYSHKAVLISCSLYSLSCQKCHSIFDQISCQSSFVIQVITLKTIANNFHSSFDLLISFGSFVKANLALVVKKGNQSLLAPSACNLTRSHKTCKRLSSSCNSTGH